jgi:hypothetical protein
MPDSSLAEVVLGLVFNTLPAKTGQATLFIQKTMKGNPRIISRLQLLNHNVL